MPYLIICKTQSKTEPFLIRWTTTCHNEPKNALACYYKSIMGFVASKLKILYN